MVLWHAGLALVAVWRIFRDPAIDYRLVVAGAVAPDVVDLLVAGRPGPAHSLAVSVGLLIVVMAATRSRRRLRRRLLALPIGTFLHLVLDGVWLRAPLLWWPLLGGLTPGAPASAGGFRPDLPLALLQELGGALALAWFVGRFRLLEASRRRAFLRSGRLWGVAA